MADQLVLNDPFARLVWRLYLLRARSILSSAPAATRIELLGDLKNHLWELMSATGDKNDDENNDENNERKRLKTALARLGDPRDFLAPLLATSDTAPTLSARIRQILFPLTRIPLFLISVMALGFVTVVGLAFLGASIGSLFDAEKYGVFLIGESSLRIGTNSGLEGASYRQLLTPASALLVAAAGGAVAGGALFALRAFALRLLALTYTASLRVLL